MTNEIKEYLMKIYPNDYEYVIKNTNYEWLEFLYKDKSLRIALPITEIALDIRGGGEKIFKPNEVLLYGYSMIDTFELQLTVYYKIDNNYGYVSITNHETILPLFRIYK